MSLSGGIFWQAVTGLLDVIILLGLGSSFINNVGQFLAFGNGRVTFLEFPFFLGQPIPLTIQGMPRDMTAMELHLRCIEEAYEIREREGLVRRKMLDRNDFRIKIQF